MASGLKDSITIEVSLVVNAIDDFTNKPISGNKLRVWIDGEKPAIQKPEGYYVFVNLRKKDFVLHIEGEIYHKQEILLDEEKLMQYEKEILKVRMIPNHCYPMPLHVTCIEGKAEPYCKIQIYCEEYANPYKLHYTYEKGSREISIYHPDGINLEGKVLCIKNKSDALHEFVQLEGKKEGEEGVLYHIRYPLVHTYKKIGTTLYPVYTIVANEKGEFYFPVSNIYSPKTYFICGIQGEAFKHKRIEIITGKVNKIDLTDL